MSHVLLIEPNTVLARTYTQALAHAGHSVVHVVGAQAAIDAADKQAPDIVVIELQLPGHNGIEFLHEFRSYAEWFMVPVILTTNLTTERLAPALEPLRRDLGVLEVFYKPQASLQDLVRLARQYSVQG